jgi:hypothetical protein
MMAHAPAIYAAYFSGLTGASLGLFFIGDGVVAGADVGGIAYDGNYSVNASGDLVGTLAFVVPAGSPLITGFTAEPNSPVKIEMPLSLPACFYDGRVVRISTPTGPVNARFERIRDIR